VQEHSCNGLRGEIKHSTGVECLMMSHRHHLDVCTFQHACRQENSCLVQQHMVHLLAMLLEMLSSQAALLFVCITLPVQLQLLGGIICVHCYPFCKLSWNTKGSACHLDRDVMVTQGRQQLEVRTQTVLHKGQLGCSERTRTLTTASLLCAAGVFFLTALAVSRHSP